MPRAKKDVWISANAAAAIMTANNGHTVGADYVRVLARDRKIQSKAVDGRTKAYLKSDVDAYRVRAYNKVHV